jgi:TDG/mug DNA glycosylase family protein
MHESDQLGGRGTRVERARALPDVLAPGASILFVGINPGLRSAALGHHFAGYSNRFWNLLFEAGLVPRPVTWRDDVAMPGWGYGLTNLVARPTAGVADLRPEELRAGRARLLRKVRRQRPAVVALVGVTVYRAIFGVQGPVSPGPVPERLGDARVFVLPNPSGRNAHYSHAQMVAAYARLRRELTRLSW